VVASLRGSLVYGRIHLRSQRFYRCMIHAPKLLLFHIPKLQPPRISTSRPRIHEINTRREPSRHAFSSFVRNLTCSTVYDGKK
jgi:hypothetical protein